MEEDVIWDLPGLMPSLGWAWCSQKHSVPRRQDFLVEQGTL